MAALGGVAPWSAGSHVPEASPAPLEPTKAPPVSASTGCPVSASTLGYDEILPAPAALAEALPSGGIARGSVVSITATNRGTGGATSLLLALLGGPPQAWCALVGFPEIGLAAAADLGVDLSRLGLVPDPGPDVLRVISVLADGLDLIALSSGSGGMTTSRSAGNRLHNSSAPPIVTMTHSRRRVLTGRLRQGRAALLVHGPWPGADLVLTVRGARWSGLGNGHGRLRGCELEVALSGRRAGSATGRMVTMRLPVNTVRDMTTSSAHLVERGMADSSSGAGTDADESIRVDVG